MTMLFVGTAFILQCKPATTKKESASPKTEDKHSEESSSNKQMTASMEEGKEVYSTYCLICHQQDGSGVSGLNPPLKGTEYVLGDKDRLIGIVINGANEGLEIDGVSYTNAMPGFPNLSDKEIALVTTYIRNSFGNNASPITEEEVKTYRGKTLSE